MNLTTARRIAAASVIGVALGAISMVATTGVAAAKSATCTVRTDDKWQPRVQGEPAGINPKTTNATYMWHDSKTGWNIRVTHHQTNLRSFAGQITTNGTFANVKPVRLEKSDTFSVSADKKSISFSFKNYGYIDGLNFMTHCASSIKFAFQSDGKTTPVSHIVIGKSSDHPKHNPFTITR